MKRLTIKRIHEEISMILRSLPGSEYGIDGAYPHGRKRKINLYDKKTGENVAIIDYKIRPVKKRKGQK